jgi:uncharacterized protein
VILFFDTSALIKRYISERGSEKVDELFNMATQILVSAITKTESYSTLRRLRAENHLSRKDYNSIKTNIEKDFQYFVVIPFIYEIESSAIKLIEQYQLKSLDSIQLSTALYCKSIMDHLVAADIRLLKSAKAEKLKTINPTEK